MRLVVQRVTRAAVSIDGELVSEIGPGLVVLVGVGEGDGSENARGLAEKVARLRIFADDDGKMNRSVIDTGGEVLAVPQFTLYGDTGRGHRPSFVAAAPPEKARPLVGEFTEALAKLGVGVREGVFGARMQVDLTNDGPVTLILEV